MVVSGEILLDEEMLECDANMVDEDVVTSLLRDARAEEVV